MTAGAFDQCLELVAEFGFVLDPSLLIGGTAELIPVADQALVSDVELRGVFQRHLERGHQECSSRGAKEIRHLPDEVGVNVRH